VRLAVVDSTILAGHLLLNAGDLVMEKLFIG